MKGYDSIAEARHHQRQGTSFGDCHYISEVPQNQKNNIMFAVKKYDEYLSKDGSYVTLDKFSDIKWHSYWLSANVLALKNDATVIDMEELTRELIKEYAFTSGEFVEFKKPKTGIKFCVNMHRMTDEELDFFELDLRRFLYDAEERILSKR